MVEGSVPPAHSFAGRCGCAVTPRGADTAKCGEAGGESQEVDPEAHRSPAAPGHGYGSPSLRRSPSVRRAEHPDPCSAVLSMRSASRSARSASCSAHSVSRSRVARRASSAVRRLRRASCKTSSGCLMIAWRMLRTCQGRRRFSAGKQRPGCASDPRRARLILSGSPLRQGPAFMPGPAAQRYVDAIRRCRAHTGTGHPDPGRRGGGVGRV